MTEKQKAWNVSAEIRAEQKAAFANMSRKEKFNYFWEYYRFHVIVTVLVVVILGNMIHGIVTSRSYSFYAVLINAFGLNGEVLGEEFSEMAGLDNIKQHCNIDTSSFLDINEITSIDAALIQRLYATISASILDSIIADGFTFIYFADAGFFIDLRLILSEDEIKRFEDNFFYIDEAFIDAMRADPNMSMVDQQKTLEQMDQDVELRRQPDKMKTPIPVGIFLSDSPVLKDAYYGNIPVAGVIGSSNRKDEAIKFVEFLLR